MTTTAEQARAPIETTDLRLLEPGRLRFQAHGARLRMTIADDCSYLDVTVIPAFPLSNPQRYLSIWSAKREIGIIADVRALDAESRRLVEQDLQRRYIVPVIRRIVAIKERFGTIDWTVETDRGRRRFTTRNLRERLAKETKSNVALRVEDTEQPNVFKVSGRGELHLSVLIETMRREGYELCVSQPEVIFKDIDGVRCEPYEEVTVDVDEAYAGAVIEKLGGRGGTGSPSCSATTAS